MNDYIVMLDPKRGSYLEHRFHKYISKYYKNGKWYYTYSQKADTEANRAKSMYDTYNKRVSESSSAWGNDYMKQLHDIKVYQPKFIEANKKRTELEQATSKFAPKSSDKAALHNAKKEEKEYAIKVGNAKKNLTTLNNTKSDFHTGKLNGGSSKSSDARTALSGRYQYHKASAEAIAKYYGTPVGKLKLKIKLGVARVKRYLSGKGASNE